MKNVKMVIVVRRDLNMRKGKMCAQVGHASIKFLTENNDCQEPGRLEVGLSSQEAAWLASGMKKVVVGIDSEDALRDLIFNAKLNNVPVNDVVDAGKTEFNGVATLTCAAFGPDDAEELDKLTGNLKLL